MTFLLKQSEENQHPVISWLPNEGVVVAYRPIHGDFKKEMTSVCREVCLFEYFIRITSYAVHQLREGFNMSTINTYKEKDLI